MSTNVLDIRSLAAGAPEIALCARWRLEAFSDVLDAGLPEECARLEAFVAGGGDQVMLFAELGGEPAGTCLLAPRELEPCHDLTPWLAGLYVVPALRQLGVGSALVRATEATARERGHGRIHLYTDESESFYSRLGWKVLERSTWHNMPMALMGRDLLGTSPAA